jgi:hypothetical protein
MKGPTFEHRNGMEIATFADAAEWETWLAAHGAEDGELWLRIARRDSEHTTVTADQALDVCLCYGWIDSLRRGDERRLLSPAVLTAPPRQPVVKDQRCQGRGLARGWSDAAGRAGRGC